MISEPRKGSETVSDRHRAETAGGGVSDTMVNRISRFEIKSILGKGSVGIVYRAYDPRMDRLIALKVLRQDRTGNAAYRERFLEEAKVIGKLDHPHIVTGYDIGEDSGTIYIAMELLKGEPLSNLIGKRDFALPEIVRLAIQVAEALDYAHSRGVVHRDIKPSNLIIASPGQVKITDFSIAHVEDPDSVQRTQAGEILGTPAYMSPEQVLGRPVSARSDFFSLGIILYELTTGKRPFKGANFSVVFSAITGHNPVEPSRLNPAVPKDLSRVIMKCLQKDPQQRYANGKELVEALEAVAARWERADDSGPVPVSRRKILVSAASALLFALITGAFYVTFNRRRENTPVRLNIDTIPTDAEVNLDGRRVGRTPLVVAVSLGKHEIRVSKSHYLDWLCRIKADQEGEIPLRVKLSKK